MALPFIMSIIVNQGIKAENFELIWHMCLVMLAVAAAGFGLALGSGYLMAKIGAGFSREVRSSVYNHTLDIPVNELNRMGTGALLTRSTHDIRIIEDFMSSLLRAVVVVPVFIVGGSMLAFLKDPWLALIILLSSPIIIVITFFVGKKLQPLFKNSNDYIDKQNTIVRERLSGIRVIRAFGQEEKEHARMARATEIMADNIIKANVFSGLITPVAFLLMNFVVVFIVFVSSYRIQSPEGFLVGDVVAIIQYVSLIMSAIFSFAWLIMFLPRIKVSTTRIGEVLKVPEIRRGITCEMLAGALVCENLCFSYPEASEPSLSDITFTVNPGEKVALIGGTGSGKSTLIMLLAGLYPVTSGGLTLSGFEYGYLTVDDISGAVATAFQKPDIFSGTIRENLDPRGVHSDDKLMHALGVAQLDDFVLKNGLDYEVNQGGSNLSGGQKQRLSIARALLKEYTFIYLFDDSFSALDYLTEQKLRARLAVELKDKSMIIATQRAATARNCDKILVFDGGKIADSGTHKELLERGGIYREIYITQTGGQL